MASLPTIHAAGEDRVLGNIVRPAMVPRAWRIFGDIPEQPLYTRSQWDAYLRPDLGADPWLPPPHDQNGVGQCNADATTAAIEAARYQQRGIRPEPLSAPDLYARINHGVDEGSTLPDGLHEAMTRGVGRAATTGTVWRPGMRLAPDSERRLYRVTEAYLCPEFQHCFSAVVAGFKLISGVAWYANYNPGLDGWLPSARGSPVGGHAVMGYAPVKKGNTYGIAHQNSWTALWGIGGRCVFPESMYADASVGGWWAVREVVDEGADVPAPLPEGSI